ncbi:hypothetical protein Tco_0536608 [Tanacetum coccineum]
MDILGAVLAYFEGRWLKYRLKFVLDRKELTLTLDDSRTIFQLPQATTNNHEHFVDAPKFSEMIMQMLYCFVNNIHVDYADLLWEGFYYSLEHPSTLIPYPRFIKLIVSHYMTSFPEISRRARDKYHNLDDDMMVKNIFNSGKHKDGVRMKILSWMITDEMKLMENYRLYVVVFRVDVPTTQSQPIESTQGMHRTSNASRSPNHDTNEGESSAPRKSTVIRLCIPQRRSTQLTPPTPIPTTAEADDIILQDTIQLSLAEQKSYDTQTVPGTRLEPRSNKESSEVEITVVEQPVNVIEEEEELAGDDYELRRRKTGKYVEESRSTPSPTTIRSLRTHSTLISSDTEKLQELTVTDPPPSSSTPSSFSPKSKISATNRLLSFIGCTGAHNGRQQRQADVAKMIADAIQQERENLQAEISLQINNAISNHIPSQVDSSVRNYMSGHILHDVPHDDAHLEGENSAKRQRTSEHETFVFGESSSDQDYKSKLGPSTSAKLRKVVDEMLRQRCASGDEHQYHIDQMQNFLKNDIVWESKKEILVSPHPQRPTLVVQVCQRDPKAPALSLVNQDLLYLKKGSSGPEKIVMSLHKFLAVNFPDDDIEERTSRWVDKCVKKFNPYARYNVKHWLNPHAKILYIKKQKEPGKPKEVVYSNSKIVQINKTYWELGHEHKFITKIVARRANGSIVSITESDYKNLNKNDIEDMYMIIVNSKVDDYAETGLLWSLYLIVPFQLFSIWKAFGGNTRDLGLLGEETDKTTDLHQHLSRLCSQRLETASQDTHDAVTIHPTTVSQYLTMESARTTQSKI